MNARLQPGFVVRVGPAFVGRFEGSARLHLFGSVDRATVWGTREKAEEIADEVFGGLIPGIGYGDRARYRVESLVEVAL